MDTPLSIQGGLLAWRVLKSKGLHSLVYDLLNVISILKHLARHLPLSEHGQSFVPFRIYSGTTLVEESCAPNLIGLYRLFVKRVQKSQFNSSFILDGCRLGKTWELTRTQEIFPGLEE